MAGRGSALSQGFVMATDRRWFDLLSRLAGPDASIDNVNFWRPSAQQRFHAVDRGGLVFFRLKSPVNRIVGFGRFVTDLHERISVAWSLFGEKNGYPDVERFTGAILDYRRDAGMSDAQALALPLTCLVLVDAVFLPQDRWLPWGDDEEWQRNVVVGKGYDLDRAPGYALKALHDAWWAGRHGHAIEEEAAEYAGATFTPLATDERERTTIPVAARHGQGAFKAALLNAYGACAVTGEHARPVLDAAHIQPYLGPRSNHPQNGLLLRTDLHRLFDDGYVTVTPDHHLEVSRRLREEFDNGRAYYDLQGRTLILPGDPALRPSAAALEWHNEHVFR